MPSGLQIYRTSILTRPRLVERKQKNVSFIDAGGLRTGSSLTWSLQGFLVFDRRLCRHKRLGQDLQSAERESLVE